MTIEETQVLDGATALSQRQAFLAQHTDLPLAQLEALRARLSGAERDDLDSLITQRRRATKALLENLSVMSELFDKAALPAAAALPVLLTLMASERLIADSVRTWLLISAYIVGGALWALCRWASFLYLKQARLGSADLGKVE